MTEEQTPTARWIENPDGTWTPERKGTERSILSALSISDVLPGGNVTVTDNHDGTITIGAIIPPFMADEIEAATGTFDGLLSTADNSVQNALDTLDDYGLPWVDYVPTFTGWTGGTYTRVGRYKKIGHLVHYWASVTILTLPSAYGTPVIGLPVNGVVGYHGSHKSWFLDAGNTYFNGFSIASTSTVQVYYWDGNNAAALITGTGPFTWAVGDALIIDGTFEPAA